TTWGFVNILEEFLAQKAQLLPRDDLGSQLRRLKDVGEIRRLEKAAQIADEALSRVLSQLKRGVSERDFAHNLEEEMYLLGSSEPSFETIVASGENSAMPHAHPTRRIFEHGDTIVIDFGATFEGYHSDMTRTFVIGEPTQEQARVYLATKEAQALAISSVREG
ncbi:proline dipeptidase, partial [mine drainage metagenome]